MSRPFGMYFFPMTAVGQGCKLIELILCWDHLMLQNAGLSLQWKQIQCINLLELSQSTTDWGLRT